MGTVIAVVAVFLFVILPIPLLSYILYSILLVRTRPQKWDRSCSMPEDEQYVGMFDEGVDWAEQYAEHKSDAEIVSDGYRLKAEYFDFGFDKAVIIIPGRMESCLYSYYFAEPFKRAGYNILAIDNRAHGLSEGKRCSLGYKEYRDIINWSIFLHDEKGVRAVLLHGICIGSSTALFALTSPDCPDYIEGMVAEGMYTTFADSFRNHMIEDKRPLFPIFYAAMMQIRIFAGADVVNDGPVKRMAMLRKPILFLHSREDIYSLPEYAEQLYKLCQAPKELYWFDTGAHSRIRVCNTEEYDAAIVSFLEKAFGAENLCS